MSQLRRKMCNVRRDTDRWQVRTPLAIDCMHQFCYTCCMEYKVIALNPPAFNGGRFKSSQIQKYLDYYAENGWTVANTTSTLARSSLFGFRSQLIITFQRPAGVSDDE